MADQPRTDRLLAALQERAKELACLYEVEECLSNPEAPLDIVFRAVIEALPPGWQHPELCEAKIEYGDATFTSDRYVETPWSQSADILVQDEVVGRITVAYSAQPPGSEQEPFLPEEARLIRTVAERIGSYVQHRQLRVLAHEWRAAHDALAKRGTREWRVILNLLRRTDQDLFVRISRKMANHLSSQGVAEAQTLLLGFMGDRTGEDRGAGEKNVPTPKRPLTAAVDIADRVFSLASQHLGDEEIMARVQRWILEDKSTFLVTTVVRPQSKPSDMADAIRRYQQMFADGAGLSRSTHSAVLVNLIRRFLSEEAGYVSIAKDYLSLDDFPALFERLVHVPGSRGQVGGKAAGLFLAASILGKAQRDGVDVGPIRIPKTWYVASDTLHFFVIHNHLEEAFEQKYKDLEQVRVEFPHLTQVFKHSEFPPEIVRGLTLALDDLSEGPLVVRSSSLLEDRLGAVFSGKYKSLFVPNTGSKQERLAALLDAIAEVFASTFSPDPIQYRAERGLLDLREEMGVMIQEVVGQRVGRYFLPSFAGVAASHNEFRWSARIRREDGLIRLVPGLGTRAVDRVRDDFPFLVAPGQPKLRVNVSPDEVIRYAPRFVDAIDVEQRSMTTLDLRALLRESGSEYPGLTKVVSVRDGDHLTRPTALLLDPAKDDLVVTFEGLIAATPFVRQFAGMLKVLQAAIGHPVEVEFASDGNHLFLLQCRPQSFTRGCVAARIPRDVSPEQLLFTANRYVSNGTVPDISHVVYVDPDAYGRLTDLQQLQSVGRCVSRLNAILPRRQFILMGPGRWGSRGDIKLGVHVTYSDISNTAMLVEIARARGGYAPDLSFGTHFFQDLVEASIRYLALYPDDPQVTFKEAFFTDSENELTSLLPEYAALEETVRVVDVGKATGGQVLRVLMNAELSKALGLLGPPGEDLGGEDEGESKAGRDDHWRWRLRMAERIAAQLDCERLGVVAMYVMGSTKNATAGPCSDIDLLVHFRGDEGQKVELARFLEGWSLCLDEMNYLRTGSRTGGLLDVHYVTDEDLAARTSYAVKIGAVTDAARELRLRS